MEGATAAALYAAENVLEAGAAIYKGLTLSTAPLEATFTKLRAPSLPRSSHTLSVIGNKAYIFGGEISPRKPVDNAMHVITLPPTTLAEADYQSIPARPAGANGHVPEARVGHSAAVIDHSIYIYGGRGGADMKALEEKGRVWVYDTRFNTWTAIDAAEGSAIPPARSYHASAASTFPAPPSTAAPNIPAAPNAPTSPTPATTTLEPPPESTYGSIIIHAGCLSAGGRTSDIWSFDLSSRTWAELPSAPEPPRGGTSLVMVRNRLYRFGGFDGTSEVGGCVDYLDLNISDTSHDKAGLNPMPLSPRGEWQTKLFSPEHHPNGKGGNRTAPSARSVCGVTPITTGQGREYLLILCGEGAASASGHEGAGKFFDDVWTFQLRPVGMTAGSVKDAARGVVLGQETGEGECVEVKYYAGEGSAGTVAGGDGTVGSEGGSEGRGLSLGEGRGRMVQEGQEKPMGRRGWFAVDVLKQAGGGNSVLVQGGVGENNERLGDFWVVSVE